MLEVESGQPVEAPGFTRFDRNSGVELLGVLPVDGP